MKSVLARLDIMGYRVIRYILRDSSWLGTVPMDCPETSRHCGMGIL